MINSTKIKEFLDEEQETFKRKEAPVTKEELDFFIKHYFKTKEIFNLGRDRAFDYIKKNYPEVNLTRRKINRILLGLELTQLFKPKKEKTTDIKKMITNNPFDIVEMDLLDMSNQEINGYKYILTIVDTFTKYLIAIPLKDKSEKVVLTGFRKGIKEIKSLIGYTPPSILTDNGSEFINQSMKKEYEKNTIKHITTKAESITSHAKLAERMNLYIRQGITKYKTQFDDLNWNKYLKLIVENYNKTMSRITKKSPLEIIKERSPSNNKNIKSNIEKSVLPKNDKDLMKTLDVGDLVRLKTITEQFEKPSNNILWSRQIYKIKSIKYPKKSSVLQASYRIETLDNKLIDGLYYKDELQKINKTIVSVKEPEKFIVQSILDEKEVKTRTGKRRLLLIKWKGYPNSENTWEPYNVIKLDVPLMVKKWG